MGKPVGPANLGWVEDQESALGLTRHEMHVRHPGGVVEAFGVQKVGQRYELEI